jgi:hypothetical protein
MPTDGALTGLHGGGFSEGARRAYAVDLGGQTSRAFLSLRESLHSCFLERSRQQEATPSFAYCSLCMLLRRCACWRRPLGFPYRT